MPVEQGQLPSIVPVKPIGTDGINQCDNVRGSAGCHYSAGIVAWRILYPLA